MRFKHTQKEVFFHESLGSVENQWPEAKICSREVCGVVGGWIPKPKGKFSQNTLFHLIAPLPQGLRALSIMKRQGSPPFQSLNITKCAVVVLGGTRSWEDGGENDKRDSTKAIRKNGLPGSVTAISPTD